MNIIEVRAGHDFHQQHFFIDIECDVEMSETQVRRIEIPRRLAMYIKSLQDHNRELHNQLISGKK